MIDRQAGSFRVHLSSRGGVILLSILAVCYYAVYWRSGLMLSGEEGVAAVVAQRLNCGERPIVDMFLGYNVGWFYPVAWIFKLFGTNYLLMRCWFFTLAILSGLAAFAAILRVTQSTLTAFLSALAVILMPGVIGRNYMGLLGLSGMLAILCVFIVIPKSPLSRFLWMAGAGILISFAWLIRIDIGFFQTILFFLTLLLFLTKPEPGIEARLRHSALASVLLIVVFLSIQIPVYRYAVQRGFGPQYAAQYWIWPAMIRDGVHQLSDALQKTQFRKKFDPPTEGVVTGVPTSVQAPVSPHVGDLKDKTKEENSVSYNPTSLKRPPLEIIFKGKDFKERLFAVLIYMPLPVSLLFSIWGLCLVLRSFVNREPNLWRSGGTLLVSTGSALVLFPQYFFWRPDMVHLAEFMVPFMVALTTGLFLAAECWNKSRGVTRACLFLIMCLASLNLGSYLLKGWQTDGSGSIAASRRRHLDFSALNGIRVKLNSQELSRDTLLRNTILAHSKPGEFVLCYPYFPMVNFMTDRPSCEYNLYADNALPPRQFFAQAKANMESHHPAVIVIGTGKINDTESSRFVNWASETYGYIRQHYRLVASDNDIEIYVP